MLAIGKANYELLCAAQELGTHFLVRCCVDRIADNGDHTIAKEMKDSAIGRATRARFAIGRPCQHGNRGDPISSIHVLPPIGNRGGIRCSG